MRVLGKDLKFPKLFNATPLPDHVPGDEQGVILSTDIERLREVFGLPGDSDFKTMTPKESMRVGIVYACTRLISGGIAQMPVEIYEPDQNGGRNKTMPELTKLINLQPAPGYSGAVFWEYVVNAMLLRGDAYAYIDHSRNGRVKQLILLPKEAVGIEKKDGRLLYHIGVRSDLGAGSSLDGQFKSYITVDQDDMLHFSNFGFDGLNAPSVINAGAMRGLSINSSMEEFSQDKFRNGALQQFAIMKGDGQWSPEQKDRIRKEFEERYGRGIESSNVPLVLDKTADIKQLSLTMEQVQLIEGREFQITDIARAFGLPSFMVNQEQKTTSFGSGVTEIGLVFLRYTLMPHIRRIEDELNRKLFLRSKNYVRFAVDSLIRGQTAERYEAYERTLGGGQKPGWMSVNDIRELENFSKIQGEEYDKPFHPSVEAKRAEEAAREAAKEAAEMAPDVGAEDDDGSTKKPPPGRSKITANRYFSSGW